MITITNPRNTSTDSTRRRGASVAAGVTTRRDFTCSTAEDESAFNAHRYEARAGLRRGKIRGRPFPVVPAGAIAITHESNKLLGIVTLRNLLRGQLGVAEGEGKYN